MTRAVQSPPWTHSASHVRLGTLQHARSLLLAKTVHGAQLLKQAETKPPQSWTECLLSLTGVDALQCPRCKIGRLIVQPLPELPPPTLADTS